MCVAYAGSSYGLLTIILPGPVTAMTLSPDGVILATFSSTGAIQLWDIADNFKLLRRIRDHGETQIEEFYCGKFSNDQELIVAGGKLKNRSVWSSQDDDNHILPCPIKASIKQAIANNALD